MTENYRKALKDAEAELRDVDTQLQTLGQRRAQLQGTIALLKSLVGQKVESAEPLTDIIRTALKGNKTGKYWGVDQVAVNVRLLGAKLPEGKNKTLASILNRLVHNGEAEQGLTDTGYVGYKWKYTLKDLA